MFQSLYRDCLNFQTGVSQLVAECLRTWFYVSVLAQHPLGKIGIVLIST
jgi:hypothetical protein